MLLAYCLGECLQPVQPACHQDQWMSLLGILAGEFLAEAARCARDENPRFFRWRVVYIHRLNQFFLLRLRNVSGWGTGSVTARSIRSGAVTQASYVIRAPQSWPTSSTARPRDQRSISASTSLVRAAKSNGPAVGDGA